MPRMAEQLALHQVPLALLAMQCLVHLAPTQLVLLWHQQMLLVAQAMAQHLARLQRQVSLMLAQALELCLVLTLVQHLQSKNAVFEQCRKAMSRMGRHPASQRCPCRCPQNTDCNVRNNHGQHWTSPRSHLPCCAYPRLPHPLHRAAACPIRGRCAHASRLVALLRQRPQVCGVCPCHLRQCHRRAGACHHSRGYQSDRDRDAADADRHLECGFGFGCDCCCSYDCGCCRGCGCDCGCGRDCSRGAGQGCGCGCGSGCGCDRG